MAVTCAALNTQGASAVTAQTKTNDPETCDPETRDPTTCDPETCDPKEARVQEARSQEARIQEARIQEAGVHKDSDRGMPTLLLAAAAAKTPTTPVTRDPKTCDPETCDPTTCDPETRDPKEAGVQEARVQEARIQEARDQEVGALEQSVHKALAHHTSILVADIPYRELHQWNAEASGGWVRGDATRFGSDIEVQGGRQSTRPFITRAMRNRTRRHATNWTGCARCCDGRAEHEMRKACREQLSPACWGAVEYSCQRPVGNIVYRGNY